MKLKLKIKKLNYEKLTYFQNSCLWFLAAAHAAGAPQMHNVRMKGNTNEIFKTFLKWYDF